MKKWLDISISAAFTAAIFLFFGLVLPYHLVFMENYQMFLYTPGYFFSTASVPGGLSDYISRFLIQFFISPWAGAAIMSVLISTVQRLTWSLSSSGQACLYPLSYIPALLLLAFFCDYQAMLTAAVSVLAALAVLAAVSRISGEMKRLAVAATLVPVIFFAFGSIGLVFIIPVIVRAPKTAAVLLPEALLFPVLAWLISNYPLGELFKGLHYCSTPDFPYMAWAAAATAVAFPLLKAGRTKVFCVVFTAALTLAAGALSVGRSTKVHNSIKREQTFKYVFLLRDRKWDDILDEYPKDGKPNSIFAVAGHNLALAEKDRLAEEMFSFPQPGPNGLLPEYKLDYLMPFALSGLYMELGMVNEAQRFAFEAMQSIPHFQRSSRCCMTMAEVARINGDYAVSEKYYKELSHTLFYRKEALKALEGMSEGDSGVSAFREKRLEQEGRFYSGERLPDMLSALYEKSEGNTLALQYLMGYLMLEGNSGRFRECYEKYFDQAAAVPKAYAQALLADWIMYRRTFEDLPWNISGEEQSRCTEFMADVTAKKPKSFLKKKYGDSYLFYLLYNKRK